jgi:subtilase family serine protease
VLVTLGFLGPALGIPPGSFFVFGGTSAGSPQWAAVISDVNQLNGGRGAGAINKRLYQLGGAGVLSPIFHDVTTGDNTFCGPTTPDGAPGCILGFSAAPGYDLGTGWGTPSFSRLAAILSADDRDDD